MGLLGSLGSLNVLLSADTAQFSSAMDKAAYTAEKNLSKIGIATKINLALLATLFIANTKNALTFADTIGDMAQRLGITSKQMSILAYAAKMSDADIETLEATMRKMYVTAYKGSDAFTALGVKVKDSSGNLRSGYDIFVDVAEAFKRMPDGVGKAAAAVEIFGKNGASIVPLLNSGKEGIAAFAEEAQRLGVVIDEETARNADRFDKFIKKSTEALKGAGIRTVDFFVGLKNDIDAFFAADSWSEYQANILASSQRFGEETQKNTQAISEQMAAFEQAAEAAEKKKKLDEEGVKLTENMRTAQEIYNDDMQKYVDLRDAGAISEETYERAVKKSTATLSESIKKTDKLNHAANDLGFTFSSAFEDAIIEGKKFSEVLVSLAQDIERILLRTAITEPLGNALSAGLKGMFSTSTKAVAVSSTTASAHGNIFSRGNVMPFSTGGIIDRPMIFPMANGGIGLAGEAGTEAIMPLFRTGNGDLGVKSGKSGGVEINVYAPEGSKVSQSSQTSGDKEQINIMIDEAVAGSVTSPGSKTYKALKNSFGLKQSLTAR